MKEPILLIMAAGMGSRYGGLKQMDPVGPAGEVILDYSIFDAKRAGFKRVIFLIKHEIEDNFKRLVGSRIEKHMDVTYAFQQPVRFKGIQVLDLIRLAAGKKMTVADACQYLAEVGLCAKDYINREVNASLSGGELKRIEIATVLARSTRLSVFDEPEAGIDLWSFQNLIQVFEKMRAQIHDSSIMIISHQERILEIADEIVVLRDGRIDASGPREEILPALIGTPSAVEACKILKSK